MASECVMMVCWLRKRHQGRFGSPGGIRLGAHLREKLFPAIHRGFSNPVGRPRLNARLSHSRCRPHVQNTAKLWSGGSDASENAFMTQIRDSGQCCVSAVDSKGRTIWIADAHRGDGKRFVVRADGILTGFMGLESVIKTPAVR